MYGSGGKKTSFDGFEVYEVKDPAPVAKRGWMWELTSTHESAGPYSYQDAVEAGRKRVAEVNGK